MEIFKPYGSVEKLHRNMGTICRGSKYRRDSKSSATIMLKFDNWILDLKKNTCTILHNMVLLLGSFMLTVTWVLG